MAQFTVYSSGDPSAPVMSGTAGALLTVLDACLVNGYGSKAAAGWTKPFANSGNVGCYTLGSGSGLSLSINDNGPGAGGAREARISGFDTLSSVSTGTNPFPTAAQGVGGVAMVVARKSTTADATARNWVIYADARTAYVFISTGDTAGTYLAFAFGDIYSFAGTGDTGRCLIVGRVTENSATITVDKLDALSAMNAATTGHFMAHTYAGGGASIAISKHGDATKGSASALVGTIVFPNGPDTGFYISPVWVCETSNNVRGFVRGFYQILQPIASFTDGQAFTGAGDYTGKTFAIVKQGGNASCYCIETSNTILTN